MSELPDLSAPSPADGPTTPGRPAVDRPAAPVDRPTDRLEPLPRAEARRGRSTPGSTWAGLALGVVLLVGLLVLVLQNDTSLELSFLWMQGTLPAGVWMLVAAVVGALLVALPALGRMLSRRPARHGRTVR